LREVEMPQYGVIGLGTFGKKVALTLTEKGASVVVIDKDRDKIEEIKDKVDVALVLDSTDEEGMRAAEIENLDGAVIALGDDQEQAILTTAILRRIGISPVIARAMDSLYAHVLNIVGADKVVIIEEQMGEEIAMRLLAPEILEKVVLTTGHILAEVAAKKEFVGRSIKELDFRNKFGVNIIAIQKKVSKVDQEGRAFQATEVNDLPGPNDRIDENDTLVVVGSETNIEGLVMWKGKK
jgi:trk system potassium uptake protein TrkA